MFNFRVCNPFLWPNVQYFTNLDFPEIIGNRPSDSTLPFRVKKSNSCEVASSFDQISDCYLDFEEVSTSKLAKDLNFGTCNVCLCGGVLAPPMIRRSFFDTSKHQGGGIYIYIYVHLYRYIYIYMCTYLEPNGPLCWWVIFHFMGQIFHEVRCIYIYITSVQISLTFY